MLHVIRQILDDDNAWRGILRGLQADFRHSVVTGQQVRDYIDQRVPADLEPVFRQYLETTMLPMLEVRAEGGPDSGQLVYRWTNVVEGFRMPVDVLLGPGSCTRLEPTTEWQTTTHRLAAVGGFDVDRDYYVLVRTPGADGSRTALAEGVCR